MEQSRRPIDLSFILHGPSSLTAPTFYQGVRAGTLLSPSFTTPIIIIQQLRVSEKEDSGEH